MKKEYSGRQIIEAFKRSKHFDQKLDSKWICREFLYPHPDLMRMEIEKYEKLHERHYRYSFNKLYKCDMEVWARRDCQEEFVQYILGEDGEIKRFFPDGLGEIVVTLKELVLTARREWIFWGEKKGVWIKSGNFIVLRERKTLIAPPPESNIPERTGIKISGIDPQKKYSTFDIEYNTQEIKKFLSKFNEELDEFNLHKETLS